MQLRSLKLAFSILVTALLAGASAAQDPPVRFLDQGRAWTPDTRAAFYVQDQGSELIPLAWYKALQQANGRPFGEAALTRFGYLANPSATNKEDLPLGFSLASSQQGPMVGMTCAACHTRDIKVDGRTIRIDGGPAFADFQPFVVELDDAVRRVLASDAAFALFAAQALGAGAAQPPARDALHEALALWSLRFHAWIGQIPADKPWGPGRVDAIAMIYNRLNGLDLGPAPTYLLADNMAGGDAPARYPFLWNAWRQDKAQWGGWAANGDDGLALARNLGQVLGVFARFHPEPKTAATQLDRDYLSANSANIGGLAMAEAMLTRLGSPVWPFPIDAALADQGHAIFNRPVAADGCAACHGISQDDAGLGKPRNWKTPTADVGTDIRQWQVVLRSARSGTLEGATIPGVVGPLKATDLSLNILKAVVTGTLVELQAARGATAPAGLAAMTHDEMTDTMRVPEMQAAAAPAAASPGAFVYEARVLQGIWAAAPYLHNGSVPSLAELLKPSAQRVKQFKIGPNYDTKTVGLASQQASDFILTTTGCEDRASGDSNCGHEFGTQLSASEKQALLEYLKTL